MRDLRISPSRQKSLQETVEIYDKSQLPEVMEAIQLRKFNQLWAESVTKSPFYKYWAEINHLPTEISSLQELYDFPILTKTVLREHGDLVFPQGESTKFYQTGGTTSEPTKFPAGEFEAVQRFADNYVGRLWWGIHPYERNALVWGHSHLYGSGISRQINKIKRATKDRVGGVLRLDGYQQSRESAETQLQKILKFKPDHIVGYSSALVRLARASDTYKDALHKLNLKGLICTADTLDDVDEALLRNSFGCPIIIEYGAAETGVIAVSREETRKICVLWNSHLVMDAGAEGSLLTTLSARKFPLINYNLGDRLQAREVSPGGSVISISSIYGRTDEVLHFRGEIAPITISVLQLTHILKGHKSVEAVQYSQESTDEVRIYVKLSDEKYLNEATLFLRTHLQNEYPTLDLSSFEIIYDETPLQSRAGKHLVIRPSTQKKADTEK